MKKLLILLLSALLILCLLPGCGPKEVVTDFTVAGTKWVSKDPDIWFLGDSYCPYEGEFVYQGEIIDILINAGKANLNIFLDGVYTGIESLDEAMEADGHSGLSFFNCDVKSCSSTTIVLTVTKNFIPGFSTEEITFTKVS